MLDLAHIGKFSEAAREAQNLCRELERGQAATPLVDHLEALQERLTERIFTVGLVAENTAVRDAAFRWLLGEPHSRVSVFMDRGRGLLDVRLQDRGWGLVTPNGRQIQFDSLDHLLGALDAAEQAPEPPVVATESSRPLTVSLAGPASDPSCALLVAQALPSGELWPGAASMLLTRCQMLVAARGSAEPPAPLVQAWAQIGHGCGCVLPLSTDAAPASRWPGSLESAGSIVLKPTLLDGRSGGDDLSPFSAAMAGLRAALLMQSLSRRLQLALEALRERHEKDSRRLTGQRQREDAASRTESASSADTLLRRPFDAARSTMQEELAALGKAVQDSSRRSILPEGPTGRALSEALAALRADDLRREVGSKTIRLSLAPDFESHLQRTIRKALKSELAEQLRVLTEGIDSLRKALVAQLEQAASVPVTLAAPTASESEIWSRMGELVSLELRYRGELPRRGFLQRLGEGRRTVFAVMMILSFVGSMAGFSWRGIGAVGLGFLVLFLGSVIYTFRSWNDEDSDRITGELDRAREQIVQECRRAVAEAQREKHGQLGDQLDQVKRLFGTRIDELQRAAAAAESERQTQERERSRGRLRRLEQQQRELQAQATRIARVRQECGSLVNDTTRAVRDVVAKAGSTRTMA